MRHFHPRFSRLVAPAALVLLASAATAVAPLLAATQSYYLTIDVPAELNGIVHSQAQILRSDAGIYSVVVDTGGALFRAMARRPDGMWLITGAVPDKINGVFYEPRDVFLTDAATTFSMYFDGSAAGVPQGAAIDAIMLDTNGDLILSFDVPVHIGADDFLPFDLVRYAGGVFSLYWSGAAAGVPAYTNVVGADRDSAGALVLTFDVPTRLSGVDFLPGQLVRWDGGSSFTNYLADPGWPLSAQLRDFSFVPASGSVPDGAGVTGTPLDVTYGGGQLALTWGNSCDAGDTDYEVYEGSITSPFAYTHTQKLCTTGGATSTAFLDPGGNVYYLVVPKNAISEGSYGRATGGAERPQGAAACLPQQIAAACP